MLIACLAPSPWCSVQTRGTLSHTLTRSFNHSPTHSLANLTHFVFVLTEIASQTHSPGIWCPLVIHNAFLGLIQSKVFEVQCKVADAILVLCELMHQPFVAIVSDVVGKERKGIRKIEYKSVAKRRKLEGVQN